MDPYVPWRGCAILRGWRPLGKGKKASRDSKCARPSNITISLLLRRCFYVADFVTFSSPDSSERGRFGFARVVHVLKITQTHAFTNCPGHQGGGTRGTHSWTNCHSWTNLYELLHFVGRVINHKFTRSHSHMHNRTWTLEVGCRRRA